MERLPNIQGIKRTFAPQSFGSIIPEGEKARITHWNGKVALLDGPSRSPWFSRVELFHKLIIPEKEQGYVIDEKGVYEEVMGPNVVYIHPEGEYKPHQRVELANYESMVIIDEDGAINIKKGNETPTIWVKDRQRIHNFHWTGSQGDTEEKTPGALNIQRLRLQETQTYFSFPVRTRDNIVAMLRLMLYYGYGDIQKLIDNNDPLGAMYNKIMATMVGFVAEMPFDDFKEGTNEKVAGHELFTGDKHFFTDLGLDIKDVVVRAWEPVDMAVQRVLERAATIQTEKALDAAEHERKMAQLTFEGQELTKAKELDQQRSEAQEAEGEREARKLLMIYSTLEGKTGEDTARKLILLHQASKADALYISPTMLGG